MYQRVRRVPCGFIKIKNVKKNQTMKKVEHDIFQQYTLGARN